MFFNKNSYRARLRRNISLMGYVTFFIQMRLYYPVAILMYHAVTGSYALGMTVFSVISLSIIVLGIPTGIWSDKWGRKPILILESVCAMLGVSSLALAFSSDYGVYWLYLSAVLYGGAVASRTGNREAIIYETLRYYRQTKNYPKIQGRMLSMQQSALAVSGVLAGAFLWFGCSFQQLALLTLIPTFMSLILTFFLVEPKKHTMEKGNTIQLMSKAFRLLIKHPRLRWYALATGIRSGLGMPSHTFMPSFIASVWPVWAIPFFRTGQNSVGALSFWFSGGIVEKFGGLKTLWGTASFASIFSFIAYLLHTAASPFILLITQISYAAGHTADTTVQQNNFTKKERSTMGSLISFITEIVTALASLLIGYFADVMGPAEALLTLLILKIVPLQFVYMHLYKIRKKKTPT